jgi:hypothetical protein
MENQGKQRDQRIFIVSSVIAALIAVVLIAPRLMPLLQELMDPPPLIHANRHNTWSDPLVTPTVAVPHATVQVHHVEAIFFDTPPLYSYALFHQAVNTQADWIEQNTQSGIGDTIYLFGYQTGQSHDREAFSPIVVPHIPQDEPAPIPLPDYVPKPGDTAYTIAQKQAEIDEKNKQGRDDWQARETALQNIRAEIIAAVHQKAEQLRHITPPLDASASDYIGCLHDAAQHFNLFPQATHTIIMASALVQNTPVNQTKTPLSLRGARVVGIYISAPTQPELQEREQAFTDIVRKAGASQVALYEPRDSLVLSPQI